MDRIEQGIEKVLKERMIDRHYRIVYTGEFYQVDAKEGDGWVPLATLERPRLNRATDRRVIWRGQEAINKAEAVRYLDYRSVYRQIAYAIQKMDLGRVVFEE